jgi:ABC-type branched-subunit amino acid transport system ATPase component
MTPQERYAHLLHSPDSGAIPQSGVYDGELGNFRTFVSTITPATGATINCGFVMFCPATGNGLLASAAGSTTALTFSVTNTSFPGANYLLTNAFKSRGIAAKLELMPSGASITTITGEAAAGITTLNSFISGTTTTDHLFDIAKAYAPITRKAVRSSWFPSGLDHTYSNYNTAPDEDRHCVFVAWRNWPVNVSISTRATYVVEYTVKTNIGVPPSGALSTPVGHAEVVRTLQAHDPHWHHSVLDDVKAVGRGIVQDVGVAARFMAREKLSGFASKMMKEAPKALPLIELA